MHKDFEIRPDSYFKCRNPPLDILVQLNWLLGDCENELCSAKSDIPEVWLGANPDKVLRHLWHNAEFVFTISFYHTHTQTLAYKT